MVVAYDDVQGTLNQNVGLEQSRRGRSRIDEPVWGGGHHERVDGQGADTLRRPADDLAVAD